MCFVCSHGVEPVYNFSSKIVEREREREGYTLVCSLGRESSNICDAPINSEYSRVCWVYLITMSRSTIIHVHVQFSTIHSTQHVSVQTKYTPTNSRRSCDHVSIPYRAFLLTIRTCLFLC